MTAQSNGAEPGVLDGVRVVEITAEPGQYAGKLFADLGADVIKIEPPAGGDAVRRQPPFADDRPGPNRSLLWWQLDSGKRSLALDLHSTDGRALLARLLSSASIVLCSGTVAELERIGAPFEALRGGQPVVVTTIAPFGWTGPKRHHPTTDLVAQAAGGILQISGEPEQTPSWIGGSPAYHHASLHAAAGTLMALWGLREGLPSQHVDVSLQESIAAAVQPEIMFWDLQQEVATRIGVLHRRPAAGVFPAADGWVGIHVLPWYWDRVVEWIDGHGMAQDLTEPRWQDGAYRLEHVDHLTEVLTAFTRTLSRATLTEEGQAHRALVFPSINALELAADPQIAARAWLVDVAQRACPKPVRHPGAPFRLSKRPWRMRTGAPDLGQHTAEILTELGVDADGLHALAAAGVMA